jgi:hypothetical protein
MKHYTCYCLFVCKYDSYNKFDVISWFIFRRCQHLDSVAARGRMIDDDRLQGSVVA